MCYREGGIWKFGFAGISYLCLHHMGVIVREEFGNLESLVFHISVLFINFAGDELE